MVGELHQRPEAVAQSPRGEQNNAPVGHVDRLSQEVAKKQEILWSRRLADSDRHPPFVALKKPEKIDRRVMNRQVGIVASQHSGVISNGR